MEMFAFFSSSPGGHLWRSAACSSCSFQSADSVMYVLPKIRVKGVFVFLLMSYIIWNFYPFSWRGLFLSLSAWSSAVQVSWLCLNVSCSSTHCFIRLSFSFISSVLFQAHTEECHAVSDTSLWLKWTQFHSFSWLPGEPFQFVLHLCPLVDCELTQAVETLVSH